jgi:hypothetical protein
MAVQLPPTMAVQAPTSVNLMVALSESKLLDRQKRESPGL